MGNSNGSATPSSVHQDHHCDTLPSFSIVVQLSVLFGFLGLSDCWKEFGCCVSVVGVTRFKVRESLTTLNCCY